jgi:cis-3-alkyl-4-acyloxetan-2-one decarboxylase
MFPARTGFEQEYPFASHELKFDGLRYHYIDEGSGPTLLFVHGNPTWSFAFRNLIKALAPRYRVLAVDHIGCGFSDKPQNYPYRLAHHVANLERFVAELGLRDITLFAHDWGGAIGMGVATRLPERFSRFVLFNTAAFRSQRIPLRIAVCRIPGLGAIGVRGLNLFSRAALRMAVARPERLTSAVRRGYLAPYDNWHDRVAVLRFVQDIPLSPSHPSYDTLVAIEEGLPKLRERPILFVWGERDWCFTTEFLDEFLRRFPDAETMRLPDAGHYVFEDAVEPILARVQEFLARQPATVAQSSESSA